MRRAHLDRTQPEATRERDEEETTARGTTPLRGGHVLERDSIVRCPKRHASVKKMKHQRVETPAKKRPRAKTKERVSIVRCPKRRASEKKMKIQRVEPPHKKGGHVLKNEERISIVRCQRRRGSE
jgi:hypothetical protein